jgi:hypothetical protein
VARSIGSVARAEKIFPKNQNHCYREIAKKLGPLGLTWSCNSHANLDYDTIKSELSRPWLIITKKGQG